MNMQLDKEQEQMKEMIKAMQEQAMHNKEIAERQVELESIEAQKQAELDSVDQSPQNQNTVSRQKQEQANWWYIIIYLKGELLWGYPTYC